MKKITFTLMLFVALLAASSCTFRMNGIQDSNARLQLERDDVEISSACEASATEKLILMVDWKRLFKKEVGEVRRGGATFSIPVIGTTSFSRAEAYALHKLIKENPGYDAILYPQFSGQAKGLLPFFQKTEVTVKAKMVKVK